MKPLLLVPIGLLLSHAALAEPAAPDSFIAGYATEHDFNGTILVQKKGEITYAKSFGLANRPFKVANTNETKYRIASITKAFTSVLILQLHEQGKIDLNQPIRTYLPDYAGEGADKVTIHQLLNHTSGLANFDTVKDMKTALESGLPTYQTPYTSDQLLAKFCSGKLVHEPGKVFDYNNADYIILGKIIERLSGATYEQVLADRILRPLKLESTGLLHQSDVIEGLADTYFYRDDLKELVPDLPVYPENWYAAGALYSTAHNVLAFSNALFGGKLLKQETLALMTTPGLDDYGYGVWAYETKVGDRKYRVVKRPGQIMGAQTQLYRFLDEDVTVIVLGNTGTADLDEFVAEIGRRVVSGNY
jgi:CubicO group peptidase (beta-lactamase class C family)